ncbi:uncharacterized protein LOC133850623 [Drosophila sulfurigaster albostrigata]|uniref:uncharacterized protein LOC133850623 n=1 Tax=Drosophila sulfurigaster albostrigata TaxID=89887 RepID=UPI002D219C0E|nr:uncharacterized protein LOC133850623 [Drosophila sulfurigaster albostrigata]
MLCINTLVLLSIISFCSSLNRSDAAAIDESNIYESEADEVPMKLISLTKKPIFVPQSRNMSKVHQSDTTTTKFINYWSKIVRDKQKRVENYARELTIYIPKYTRDADGNWIAINWRPTPNNIWEDTRLHATGLDWLLQTKDVFVINYRPGRKHSTVCYARSTQYIWPFPHYYLKKSVQVQLFNHRAFYDVLRYQIYHYGRSEECHDVKYSVWSKYMECALFRNMRMDYLIPKYPLHQKGYFANWKLYI